VQLADQDAKLRLRESFVGRTDEVGRIAAVISQGWAAGIALTGDDGVGKSRLLSEVEDGADRAAYHVIRAVTAPASAEVRFGALADHLPLALLRSPFGGESARTAAEALLALAGRRRLVLVADDSDLFDAASADLVLRMARGGDLFVLTTVRRGRTLAHPLTDLWSQGLAEWMEIGPLPRTAVERMLTDTLRGPVDGMVVQRFWEATNGNSLLLRGLITAQLEAGRFIEQQGLWRLAGQFEIPSWLIDLVGERVSALPADGRAALELLAVTEPMRLDVLGRLVPADGLEAAEAHGMITVEERAGRPHARLAYPLHGEAIRATTPLLRVLRRRAECAGILEDISDDPVELARAAAWRLAGHQAPDPASAVAAACGAWSALDSALAAALGQRAADAGRGAAVAEPLGYGLLCTGHAAEAETTLARLWRGARDDDRARLAAVQALNLFLGLDRDRDADRLLRRAAQDATAPAVRAWLLARQALLRALAADHRAALELAATAAALADEPEAVVARGLALVFSGRPADGIRVLAGIAQATGPQPAETPWLVALAGLGTVHGLLWLGRIEEADRYACAEYARALADRWPFAIAVSCVSRSLVARMQGRALAELQYCQEGVATTREHGTGALLAVLLGLSAHAQALLGDGRAAAEGLAEAKRLAGSSMRLLDCWTGLSQAWVASATHGDAMTPARRVLQLARTGGNAAFEAVALHDLARFGAAREAADRLRGLAEETGSGLVALYAAHARAVAEGNASELAEVSVGFERAGLPLLAAEAAAEEASRHREAGRAALATAATARAVLLAGRCGPVPRCPALGALQIPRITPRENEIARLAVHGLSSKEIGSRLVLSVRTVDNHLCRVYRKFGINTRTELARLRVLLNEASTA
jgi:DNA-binding CsgD family transcriptional regulator